MKTFLRISGLIALLGLPVASFADNNSDLFIINNTGSYVTTTISQFICSSSVLGDDGITNPNSSKTISAKNLSTACILHTHKCHAEVHLSKDCSGPAIAAVDFDISTGVIPGSIIQRDSSHYTLSGSGFHVILDPINTALTAKS